MRWTGELADEVVRRLHPENPSCPLCGSHHTLPASDVYGRRYPREWDCHGCGCSFTEND